MTREITLPITLPFNILNLNFFRCERPTVNTEMVTFNIGIIMALTFCINCNVLQ